MADLTIVADVRNGQTMSQYRIPKSGKLTFVNAASSGDLVIQLKDPNAQNPFCGNNQTTPVSLPITVQNGMPETVKICADFQHSEFLYSAAIGGAAPEDPIVIIEKSSMLKIDGVSLAIGLIVGAAVTAIVLMLMRRQKRQMAA